MHRVAFVDLEAAFDDVFAHIDAGEDVIVTRDGRDYMRLGPVANGKIEGEDSDGG